MLVPIVSILLLAVLLIVWEAPHLRRQGWKRELYAFYVLLGIAVTFSILYVLNVPPRSPIDGIIAVFEPVAHWMNHVLGTGGY